MKKSFSIIAVLVLLLAVLASAPLFAQQKPKPQDAVGKWQTYNGTTLGGQVEIYMDNGKLYGKVIGLKPGRKGPPVCEKCSGDMKDKPLMGLVILKDFSPDGDIWTGGTVTDPENGKTYKGKITPISKDTLELRGFVGISMFGRNETWKRLPN